ncbi:MAG: SMP-30/gluconolactonase/LRE family protein [Chloroflexi bacterium]|nr:SMP-30/gluconolactonase/LRE family protein [Chloroflexota bacterium]
MLSEVEFERRLAGFDEVVPQDCRLERVATGFAFTEGPVWFGERILFADIVNSRIVAYAERANGPDVTTFRCPSDLTNGMALDLQGRLLACEGLTRQVVRYAADGSRAAIATSWQGRRLNSPNDVICAADGSIYFTDPFWGDRFVNPYGPGVKPDDRELDFAGVFQIDPSGAVRQVARDFTFPNGLSLSPDGKTLYVDDTREMHIRAFTVQADGSLSQGRILANLRADEPGVPDGMKVDVRGRIFCTGPGGIWVIAPDGAVLGRIRVAEVPANVGWGGADRRTLYVTARTSLYRIRLPTPGV